MCHRLPQLLQSLGIQKLLLRIEIELEKQIGRAGNVPRHLIQWVRLAIKALRTARVHHQSLLAGNVGHHLVCTHHLQQALACLPIRGLRRGWQLGTQAATRTQPRRQTAV